MKLSIQITEDERKAFLKIISEGKDDLKTLTVNDLKKALARRGIVAGIKESILDSIWRKRIFNKKILVAEAVPPQPGKNAKIRIKVKPKERSTCARGVDLERKVDHYGEKEGFITFVKEGEILATLIPPTYGKPGTTVTGKEDEKIMGSGISWLKVQGKNTKVVDNGLIAAKDGILKREGTKLHIEQTILLERDLGVKTGSIILPLNVDFSLVVPGDIKSGFSAQCRKITVKGSVEDATVTAKILEVESGIVGKSDKPVTADYLTAGFISGSRKIMAKFLNVTSAVSSGVQIQADFVRSLIIQESSITAHYGVMTDYMYGYNTVRVGADIRENGAYNPWIAKLEETEKALKDLKIKNRSLLKKEEKIREMAKSNPNNYTIQNELKRIDEVVSKIRKTERNKREIEYEIQSYGDKMYLMGSSFIAVKSGFSKKSKIKKQPKPINEFIIGDHSYDKSKPFLEGIYILRDKEVILRTEYNEDEITALMEKYRKASLTIE